MKKLKKLMLVIFILMILSHIYNNFFTNSMLIGIYKNKNFARSPIEPNIPDKIFILENNKFSSEYFGKGTYKISYSIRGTEITLNNFNGTPYETSIQRIWYGRPKIIIFSDLGHYYEKM